MRGMVTNKGKACKVEKFHRHDIKEWIRLYAREVSCISARSLFHAAGYNTTIANRPNDPTLVIHPQEVKRVVKVSGVVRGRHLLVVGVALLRVSGLLRSVHDSETNREGVLDGLGSAAHGVGDGLHDALALA